MTLNTLKCNRLTSLRWKWLTGFENALEIDTEHCLCVGLTALWCIVGWQLSIKKLGQGTTGRIVSRIYLQRADISRHDIRIIDIRRTSVHEITADTSQW